MAGIWISQLNHYWNIARCSVRAFALKIHDRSEPQVATGNSKSFDVGAWPCSAWSKLKAAATFADSKYPSPDWLSGQIEYYRSKGVNGYIRQEIKFFTKKISEPNAPYFLALRHAQLGERDEALHWLERAVERRPFLMAFVGADPVFDDLRTDPRFQAVLRRMNLPSSSQ